MRLFRYNIVSMKRFSGITIGLGIYIVISASFMLQVRSFLIETFGDAAVKRAFFLLFFLVAALYVVYIIYKRLPLYSIALSLFIFALAYLLILWQPFFSEKLHVLEYGILGYLALRDLSKRDKKALRNIIYAVGFVLLVTSLDEGFQYFLPYRVGEMRDVVTNIISGFLGIVQCRLMLS